MKNVIVGQSGGPTAVINSSLLGVYETAKELGADTVYGMLYGIEGLLEEHYIDMGTVIKSHLDMELLKRTPSSFLGSCRYKMPSADEHPEVYDKIFEILTKLDIFAFFYIGGNDSMDTVKQLSAYARKIKSPIIFIGCPKTIDNDLPITDHTPGYGSAAKYIAATTKEIIRDGLVYNYPAVTIVEIMGRNAGWLTAAAALTKGEDCEGVDMILLPEYTFDMERFLSQVEEKLRHKVSIVIAVSEGIKNANGKYVCEGDGLDAFGHSKLTGTGKYLENAIANKLHIKTRAIELSSLQRCAAHIVSRVDLTEAYNTAAAAVRAAFDGKTGVVVCLKRISDKPYMCVTDIAHVDNIANVEKKVPKSWITPDGIGVTQEFIDYARPLIQMEITPLWVDGLPRHLVLKK